MPDRPKKKRNLEQGEIHGTNQKNEEDRLKVEKNTRGFEFGFVKTFSSRKAIHHDQ